MNQHNVSLFFSLVQKNNDARLIGLVRPHPPPLKKWTCSKDRVVQYHSLFCNDISIGMLAFCLVSVAR